MSQTVAKDPPTATLATGTISPAGTDPLARLLIADSPTHLARTVTVLLALFSLQFVMAWLEGNFHNEALRVDGAGAFGAMASATAAAVVIPIMFSAYFGEMPDALDHLLHKGVLDIDPEALPALREGINRVFRARLLILGPLALAASLALWSYFEMAHSGPNWKSLGGVEAMTWAGAVGIATDLAVFYIMAMLFFRIGATYFALKRLMGYHLDVQPLNPDGAGGLGELGRLSGRLNTGFLVMSVLAMIAGLHVSNNLNFSAAVGVFSVIAYFVGCSVLYFGPLLPAHKAMKQSRLALLEDINQRFTAVNNEVMAEIRSHHYSDPEKVSELERIRYLYGLVRGMPTYPFNVENLRMFFASLASPFVFSLLLKVSVRAMEWVLP